MAKKSTATRQVNAARRSQASAKSASVALVRAAKPETAPGGAGTATAEGKRPTPQNFVVAAPRPRAPEAPKTARPAARQEQPAAARQAPRAPQVTESRIARARRTQGVRAANAITPEHYGYVINDLKLIAGLAVTMFVIVIALHFILPQ